MAIAHPELGMIGEAARQLLVERERLVIAADAAERGGAKVRVRGVVGIARQHGAQRFGGFGKAVLLVIDGGEIGARRAEAGRELQGARQQFFGILIAPEPRSEEHTSELQSLMRISYAVFCLKKKNNTRIIKESEAKHY